MISNDRWRASTSSTIYRPVEEKDMPVTPHGGAADEYAYWVLAKQVEERLGSEGGTPYEIYRKVTAPLGLTQSDTVQLLRKGRQGGYFK